MAKVLIIRIKMNQPRSPLRAAFQRASPFQGIVQTAAKIKNKVKFFAIISGTIMVICLILKFLKSCLIFPHPFFWFAAILAGFGGWTFVSERRKVTKPHPKASKPIRLALESVLFAVLAFALMLVAVLARGTSVDRDLTAISIILGLSVGLSYFLCPFLGYNFFWNSRFFSGLAPFLLLMVFFLFIYMGTSAQLLN